MRRRSSRTRKRRRRRHRRRSRVRRGGSLLGGVLTQLSRALPVVILAEALNLQGKRMGRSRSPTRRPQGRGASSKTHPHEQDYSTKRGDRVHHRTIRGRRRYVRKKRKPYTRRRK